MEIKLKACMVLAFAAICIKITSQNTNLINDYLNYFNIKTSLFVTCADKNEMYKIITELHKGNVYVNVLSISQKSSISTLNYTQFFIRFQNPVTIVINLSCEGIHSFLELASERILFHLERTWLIFSYNISQPYDALNNQNINLDAEIISVVPARNGVYQIFDIYNPSKVRGGRLNITEIGKWNQQSGIQMYNGQTKNERRQNLGGLKFISVISLSKPIPNNQTFIEHLESNEYTQLNTLDRNVYKLFELIREMYNFKVLMRRATTWISIGRDGRWGALLGMVKRGDVDLAISALRHQDDRYGQIESTTHCFFAQVKFIFQHPKLVNASNVFIYPFNNKVWLVLTLLGIFIAIALRQTFVTCSKRHEIDCTYSNYILIVFGIFVQQGCVGSTSSISSRLLALTLLIFSILMFQFYSSFILSSLLIDPPKTIKTMSQLLQSKLEYVVDDVPYVVDNLRNSKDESAMQVYKHVMENPKQRIVPITKGLDLIKRGGFALNSDGSYVYPKLKEILTDKEICNLQEVEYKRKVPCGPVVPNKSPLRELIKISLTKFHETGLMQHHWKIWIGKKPECQESFVDVKGVDWEHVSSAAFILLIGIKISIFILLAEMSVNYFHKRSSEQSASIEAIYW